MKRLVALALLIACHKSSDEPKRITAAATGRPHSRTGTTAGRAATGRAAKPIAGVMPVPGDFKLKDFAFTSGEKLPELRIHYVTLGTALKRDAAGHVINAVLILHGTGGSGHQFAAPQFADVLFAPGGLLDPAKYFLIMPDDIGHGDSSKPSDGLHDAVPALRLRRHGRGRARARRRGLGVAAAAPGDGHVDGLHAQLHVRRDVSGRRDGRPCRSPARPWRWPAATGCGARCDRRHPARPGLDQRRVHQAAARRPAGREATS